MEYQGEKVCVKISSLIHEGILYYFWEAEDLFSRKNVYNYPDELRRFTIFSKVVIYSLPKLEFHPDIVHYHDWHMGFLPYYIREVGVKNKFYQDVKTVLTIHNFGYQGEFNLKENLQYLEFSEQYIYNHKLNYFDKINYMEIGIRFTDIVNTVSNTYAKEVENEIAKNKMNCPKRIYGVVNGLDIEHFNPKNDPNLFMNYDSSNFTLGKINNKRYLQKKLGLVEDDSIPMIIMISRLILDKGYDLIEQIYVDLLKKNIQFIIMGDGEEYSQLFFEVEEKYRDKFRYFLYDDKIASQLYAAADIFLMPSHYEPCGTTQLISMKYGVITLARATGGILDTIIDYEKDNENGTGFLFHKLKKEELLDKIEQVLSYYYNKDIWYRIALNGEQSVLSWDEQIEKYVELFNLAQGIDYK